MARMHQSRLFIASSMLSVFFVLLVLVIASCLALQLRSSSPDRKEIVVAVYEHRPVGNPQTDTPLQLMRQNTAVYRTVAKQAALAGAELLVFPEYGTYATSNYYSRDTLLPYLQKIPVNWSPCQEDIPGSEIFQDISCIAKTNNITIVANIGTVFECSPSSVPACPADGRFQYNTNVIFNGNGYLVTIYHKVNLFGERNFNQPPVEHVKFPMEFGEIGAAVCFDLLFKEPATGLVEKSGVDVVALPTFWFNRIPFLAMYEYAEAWAVRMKTFLLVANLHIPEAALAGSGIFGPTGVVNYTYVTDHLSGGQLVIGRITRDLTEEVVEEEVSWSSTVTAAENFTALTNADLFSYVKIPTGQGEVSVCQGSLCCHLKYNLQDQPHTKKVEGFFGLGAFSGMHRQNYTLCNEVCGVVRCVTAGGTTTCGEGISQGSYGFRELHLQGSFSKGTYRFPTVLVDDARLAQSGTWEFSEKKGLKLLRNAKLLVFGIYGRCFDRLSF